MPYWRFQLIHRYLRPFDYTKIDENAPLPKVFQAAEEWSNHIQRVSAALFQPGSHLAVDECMVRYTGRSTATTVVKGKPAPLGFKIWVIAQEGFFIRWLWHFKGSNYHALSRGPRRKRGRPSTQEREAASKEAAALTQLGNTQGVVISLCDMLPKQTYHVFVDNLFSTPPLFRKLRDHGYGATGTARPNCGIHKDLKRDKALDKLGRCDYAFNEVRAIPTRDNKVNQIAWKDNSLVLFITTVFRGDERTEKKRKKPSVEHPRARPIQQFFGDETAKVVPIPTAAAAYNDEMNHIDRAISFNYMVPSQIGRDISHRRIGGSVFQTPYSTHIIKKVKQESSIGQGLKRTSMIKKHGKNT
ncbi:hypothetical protein FOXB_02365 [Fusarium oxysporum f. sp. conglutinans Fo5176]|uniref:PiggyBac transposable element-derived protein domain-containing protein n=1 Tax=Fusarium oxysporum (strain Fo5176) TaxID=660025 RepID=F9F7J0_FUSOF|nr:hypothetical protein FOXB_02365 [Fusarium oxysporum f. sp. conglutinans Fo5176]